MLAKSALTMTPAGMSADGAPRGERAQQARRVLVEQLTAELAYKEDELQQIEDRIGLAKMLLRRLRLGVLAQHYGLAGFAADDYREENVGLQRSWEAFEHELQSNNEAASTSEGLPRPARTAVHPPLSRRRVPSRARAVAWSPRSAETGRGWTPSLMETWWGTWAQPFV